MTTTGTLTPELYSEGDHLGLYPLCGACGDTTWRHERVIALRGNQGSTCYVGHTRPFPFPQLDHNDGDTVVDGYPLCRLPDCYCCATGPEFIPVHYDCFEIYRQRCTATPAEALRRLWTLAAWRTPWNRAYPVYFPLPRVNKAVLRTMSQEYQLPLLPVICALPTEILHAIQAHSKSSLLWRCALVLELADFVSATDSTPLLTMPLASLESWERNGPHHLEATSATPRPMLITIDRGGISKVERLSSQTPSSGERHHHSAFMFLPPDYLSGAEATLMDGSLRLVFPHGESPVKIWNTPIPPDEALCRADPTDTNSCQFLRFVELDDVKGITFFFLSGNLSGIHAHHSDESCAMDTYTRELGDRGRRIPVVWIYLPIATRDRVLLLGTRRASQSGDRCILVRTKLAGDIIIGKEMRENVEDCWLAAPAPVAMLYGDPKPGRNIAFFGGHNKAMRPDPALLRPFELPGPGNYVVLGQPYFSWAPLGGVSSVVVFSHEGTGACRGILFRYHDGGARAVGQCRLYVDPTTSVLQPVQICFRTNADPSRFTKPTHTLQVKFRGTHPGDTSNKVEEGWESRQMEGIIKFWICGDDYESSYLEVGK